MDLTDPQQWHVYAYSHNSPVTFSDPSGLIDTCDGDGNVTCPPTTPPGEIPHPDPGAGSSGGGGGSGGGRTTPSFPDFIKEHLGKDITDPYLTDEVIGQQYIYYYCIYITFQCADYDEAYWADEAAYRQELWLGLLGYTDAVECAGGDGGACAWTAMNVVPFGRLGKLAKLGKVAEGPAYLSKERWAHIKDGHFPGGKDVTPNEGVFIGDENLIKDRIYDAIHRGRPVTNTDGRPGFTYTVDFGGYEVGYKIDRSGQRISLQFYTVVVNDGRIVTAYPH